MAHSYIEAYGNEEEAFVAYARANPSNVTFLIDTYETINGARCAVKAAKKIAPTDIRLSAVRLDSGDILGLSGEVRILLDREGLQDVKIFVSGNMDEYAIQELLSARAPIDGFGVGTKLDTAEDAPYLECAYKLVEYAGKPRMKTSAGKVTLPGRKQIFRRMKEGTIIGDTIALVGEEQDGLPLMEMVMKNGRRLLPRSDLEAIRGYTKEQLRALPGNLRQLEPTLPYDIRISSTILQLQQKSMRSLGYMREDGRHG